MKMVQYVKYAKMDETALMLILNLTAKWSLGLIGDLYFYVPPVLKDTIKTKILIGCHVKNVLEDTIKTTCGLGCGLG